MMILSCGHREDDMTRHYNVMTKEWTRENTKAVAYKCVCLHCFKLYENEKSLIRTDDEAYRWLRGQNGY